MDLSVAAEAEVDRAEGLVIPVTAEMPDEAEEWEPGPVAWPILV